MYQGAPSYEKEGANSQDLAELRKRRRDSESGDDSDRTESGVGSFSQLDTQLLLNPTFMERYRAEQDMNRKVCAFSAHLVAALP